MSEYQANEITIWAIAIAFPLIGLGKLYLSQVMRKSTQKRTIIGDWLVRMFIAIGFSFICVGIAYGLSVFAMKGWIELPIWARWVIRISAVITGIMSLVATVMVVKAIKPLLKSPFVIDSVTNVEDHLRIYGVVDPETQQRPTIQLDKDAVL